MAFSQEIADSIYALCCPRTGEVRYIGKARDAAARFASHLRETRRKTPVYCWIDALRLRGLTPSLRVVLSTWDWRHSERAVIAQYRAEGARLLNLADGGDEPFCSKEQRAANGRRTAAALHSDPRRKRIWQIKRQLSEALRRGELDEDIKAKMRMAARNAPALFGAWAAI